MENRKKEHLHLAFESFVNQSDADTRFQYEPVLSAHPEKEPSPITFLGKTMKYPFWISSMTGGTKRAGSINARLAKVVGDFGLGMGLGSCRVLFESDDYWSDFKVRNEMGYDAPLYSNLGIAQLEQLIEKKEVSKIDYLNQQLEADGTIIHINPLQEAFQQEGDVIKRPPIESIQELVENVESPIIVKEVGQGMGYESLKALLQLNIAALEFGALGGTNFTRMEQIRNHKSSSLFDCFAYVGHTAQEMTMMVNDIVETIEPKCKQLIISGGIKTVLDGYYLSKISKLPAIVGMGSAYLQFAIQDYQKLHDFVEDMVTAWKLAETYLTIRE